MRTEKHDLSISCSRLVGTHLFDSVIGGRQNTSPVLCPAGNKTFMSDTHDIKITVRKLGCDSPLMFQVVHARVADILHACWHDYTGFQNPQGLMVNSYPAVTVGTVRVRSVTQPENDTPGADSPVCGTGFLTAVTAYCHNLSPFVSVCTRYSFKALRRLTTWSLPRIISLEWVSHPFKTCQAPLKRSTQVFRKLPPTQIYASAQTSGLSSGYVVNRMK